MLPGENFEDDVFFCSQRLGKYFIRFFGCQVDDQLDLKMIFLPFDGLQSFTDKKAHLNAGKLPVGPWTVGSHPFQKKHHLVDQNGSIHSNKKTHMTTSLIK